MIILVRLYICSGSCGVGMGANSSGVCQEHELNKTRVFGPLINSVEDHVRAKGMIYLTKSHREWGISRMSKHMELCGHSLNPATGVQVVW